MPMESGPPRPRPECEPRPREKRAVVRITLDLLHRLLLLPDTVQIEAAHVGVDDFQHETLSIRLGGDGLPVEPVPRGTLLPEVTVEYRTTLSGPTFTRFVERPRPALGDWDMPERGTGGRGDKSL